MRKHTNNLIYICPVCWYASGSIDTTWKKYKRSMIRWIAIYTLVEKTPVPKAYNHYPRVSI